MNLRCLSDNSGAHVIQYELSISTHNWRSSMSSYYGLSGASFFRFFEFSVIVCTVLICTEWWVVVVCECVFFLFSFAFPFLWFSFDWAAHMIRVIYALYFIHCVISWLAPAPGLRFSDIHMHSSAFDVLISDGGANGMPTWDGCNVYCMFDAVFVTFRTLSERETRYALWCKAKNG